ncbi:MAG: hypothetical protein EOP56_10065 [Sphingobacteriales bacterium]|nr:MAG: hypothetical protein EOP56_10065 [Sphingobacteriales bacterium]
MFRNDDLELLEWHQGMVSLKLLTTNQSLNSMGWDRLFDCMAERTKYIYFAARRPDVADDSLLKDLQHLSHSTFSEHEANHVLFSLPDNILLNRGLLSTVWSRYQSPAIVFAKSAEMIKLIERTFHDRITPWKEFCDTTSGVYICYKGMEEDVLWVVKSPDMPDLKHLIS